MFALNIWSPTPRWLKYILVVSALLIISALRAWSIFNYSIWNVDEEQVVIHALGFLDYDFNPRWFEYHTLPMYLLSILYFIAYYTLRFTGIVTSNVEFASLVFTEHRFFFTSARLLFSCAHTLGCIVIAYVIAKNYKSISGAFVFITIVFLLPESVVAANTIRVDTFVFLFLVLTVYFSCFAKKNQINFILSILFCTASFSSKIPAIIFFPVLFSYLSYQIYIGTYPKYYFIYFLVLPLVSLLFFMPYMLIEYESYYQHLERIGLRASGEFIHVGKVHNFDFFSKLNTLYRVIAEQVGHVSILCSLTLFVVMLIKKDSAMVTCIIFVLAYSGMFATSAAIDTYWLIPVLPFFTFFGTVLIVVFTREALTANTQVISNLMPFRGDLTRKITVIFLLMFALSVFGVKPRGLNNYIDIVGHRDSDTRITAGSWIKDNLPLSSLIILDGFIQHYLPRVVSRSQNETLINSYFDIMGAIRRNSFLMESFAHYYTRAIIENPPFDAKASINNFRKKYDSTRISLPLDAYIVISDSVYNRFSMEHTKVIAPTITRNALDFYSYIETQKHIKTFSGRGPKIDIYQIVGPSLEAWVASKSQNLEQLYATAVSLQKQGEMEASLSYLAEIATLQPGYRFTLFLTGWANQKLGRWPEAESNYIAGINRYPRHFQSRFNLAYGLMQQSRCREAINSFEVALQIIPGHGSTHHWLGKCYAALGDTKAAARHEAIFQSTRK